MNLLTAALVAMMTDVLDAAATASNAAALASAAVLIAAAMIATSSKSHV